MKQTVLIVDDHAITRAALANILRGDYEIIEAENGEAALALLKTHAADVVAVLTDVVMPAMDGYALLREIRRSAQFADLPVLMVTGSEDEASRVKALSLGANDFILKPCNPDIIKHCVKNAVALSESTAALEALRRDKLTGLYTRESFFDQARRMCDAHEPGYYTMACFDVENFKIINEQYGVEIGDIVLKHIADTLDRGVKLVGGICCRYTADRFGVFYPTDQQDSSAVRLSHEQTVSPDCLDHRIKIRLGRYRVNDLSLPVSAMYDRAALAEESIRGKYNVTVADYGDAMSARLVTEQRIVNEMTEALAGGEFEPWFQPQYNHATGALIGAEALARWRHGDNYISPSEFVPVFERNGFIYEMDKYIWDRVCQLMRGWIDAGKEPLPVSVNISRRDLFNPDCLDVLQNLLKQYALPIALLRLEVTETAFAENGGAILEKVNTLIKMGFTVEIDDFGSGYSSLNTLKDVPADILKLDMRFFEKTENQQRGGNIVSSIVRMAKWLGMAVIAEGVEDKEQADYLMSIGCYYIQGYYYARPMPAGDYELLFTGSDAERQLTRLQTLETLDNSQFWSPESMDTLIFNSYVGGACIFEYVNGKTELLRVNDQYTRELGGLIEPGISFRDAIITPFLDQDGEDQFEDTLRRAVDERRQASCELKLTDGRRTEYLRLTARLIARSGDHLMFYCVIQNLTSQREAERKQAEAARKLDVIIENIGGGVSAAAMVGEKARYLFTNEHFYTMLGYTKAQFEQECPNGLVDRLYPEDREHAIRNYKAYAGNGGTATNEFRVIKRDGSVIWLHASGTLCKLGERDEVANLAVYTDVTEKRSLEAQLSTIVENILVGISTTTYKDGNIEIAYANDGFYALYGYTRDQWAAEVAHAADPILPEDRAQTLDTLARIVREGRSATYEYRCRKRDGSVMWTQTTNTVIGAEGGAATLLAVSADTTERHHAEAEKDAASERLTAVMDHMSNGMTAVAFYPDHMVFLLANRRFYEMQGITAEDCDLQTLAATMHIVHPDDRTALRQIIENSIATKEPVTATYRIVRPDGVQRWITATIDTTRLAGVDAPVQITIYTDVTEQKDAQKRQLELLDNLPAGAALYTYDGATLSVVHINKRYWQLAERKPTPPDAIAVWDAIHPDDLPTAKQELDSAIRQQRNVDLIIRVRYRDADYKPFRVTATPAKRADGTYLLYAAYIPVSEDSVSFQEFFPIALSAMMSSSDDYSFVKDLDARYIGCSHAMAKLLGLPSERDIIGKTDAELIDAASAAKFAAQNQRVLDTGVAHVDFGDEVHLLDGSVLYVSSSVYPIKDSRDNVVGLYGVSRDVSRERRLNFELTTLLQTMPGGVMKYAADDEARIAYVNRNFVENLGYTEKGFVEKFGNSFRKLVWHEDLARVDETIRTQETEGRIGRFEYRVEAADGSLRWIHDEGVRVIDSDGQAWYYVSLFDVTEQHEAQEALRMSEELNRLAIEQSGRIISRFDVASRTLTLPEHFNSIFEVPRILRNMPEEQIALGRISPETASTYRQVFADIVAGEPSGVYVYQQRSTVGWRWLETRYTTVFSEDGKPVSAVVSFADITEQREKEAAYSKWINSMKSRPLDSYTLFRCNLTRGDSYDLCEGALFQVDFPNKNASFSALTAEFVRQKVYGEDAAAYTAFVNADTMLAEYYRGHRSKSLEFREKRADGSARWLRLSIDLVEYPNSRDIEAYLMYENIDEGKREALHTLERAETDPLTGILNRTTFATRVDQHIRESKPGAIHALLMLDIDNFKRINDTFGHGAGDQALVDLASNLRVACRRGDLVGRLGGDEFVVFLPDIADKAAATNKARHICELSRKALSHDVHVSNSVGIAYYPEDGDDFETLYRVADQTLYRVKESGKGTYASSHDTLDTIAASSRSAGAKHAMPSLADKKPRMLVIGDNKLDQEYLAAFFKADYKIESATSSAAALLKLNHYKSAISVALLDLMMPEEACFEILKAMQENYTLSTIPVIVLSTSDRRQVAINAIRAGASDFITKPVDADLLRIRVQSAVSKAENERLRAQNSYLAIQSDEVGSYQTVMDRRHTFMIVLDWSRNIFMYSPAVSNYIAGRYDDRSLWRILLSDAVADVGTVQKLQQLIHQIANDRTVMDGHMTATLKSPGGDMRAFEVTVYKVITNFGLTDRIILTLQQTPTA